MSTNYYLRPIKYKTLDEINEKCENKLYRIEKEYNKSIKELIIENNKITAYKDLLDEDNIDVKIVLKYKIEIPDIHICKLSKGWLPQFEANKNFKSYNEFELYYLMNKDYFDIVDEYNEKISLVYLYQKIQEHIQDKDNYRSHLEETSYWYGINRWIDKDNNKIEWTDANFC